MKNTTITGEPATQRQPVSASEAAALRAEHSENAPPAMHVCLFRSGWVDVLQLTADDVDLADIAHGLALTNRWNGGTRDAVSVAWHSLVVSALASEIQPAAALHGLMHDAAEAYTGDWTQPYKLHLGPMLTAVAERIEHACLEAAGVKRPAATIEAVKEADEAVLLLEHASRWGMNQHMRREDQERVARAHEAAKRVNPHYNGAPFTLANKSESAFVEEALWLMPAAAPMRRRLERAVGKMINERTGKKTATTRPAPLARREVVVRERTATGPRRNQCANTRTAPLTRDFPPLHERSCGDSHSAPPCTAR